MSTTMQQPVLTGGATPGGSLTGTRGKADDARPAGGIPAYLLMRELTGTVPIFGGRKVRIGFFGDQAFVNFKSMYVNLPALPASKWIPGRIAQELRGFSMHEAAHLLFTDEHVLEHGRTEEEKQDRLLHETWNAIEDYFIDRNFGTIYPGYHKNNTACFHRTTTHYLNEVYAKQPDVAKDLRQIGPVALTWCRAIYFGCTTPAPRDALETMPQALQDRIWDHFWSTELVASSQDCLDLARVIADDFRQSPFDPNNMPQNTNLPPQQGQACGGGGGGQGGGGQSGGNGPGGKGGSAPYQANPNQQAPDPVPVGRSINDILKDLGDISDAQTREIVVSSWSSEGNGRAGELLAHESGIAKYNEVRGSISGTVGTVARVLRRDLTTITRERWRGGRSDGVLDSRKLHRVFAGANDVYKRKTTKKAIDTALSILIDCSGSMGSTIDLCQEMAIALEAALVNTPVKIEIIGYRSTSDQDTPASVKPLIDSLNQAGEDFHRKDVEMLVFKSFEEGRTSLMRTLGNMSSAPGGGTPTGEAIMLAGARLLKRKEGRHVMFVLTDGQPDDNDTCVEAVTSLERCGVAMFGFGIRSDAVRDGFRHHAVISEVRELGSIVISTLSKMLVGSADLVPQNKLVLPTHIYTE